MEEILSSSRNSFLDEIDRNKDISSDIRREIDLRYQNSLVNKTYKFPRVIPDPNSQIFNSSLILFKRKACPTLSKVQTLSSIYVPNNHSRKLPDLTKKIRMKNISQKLIETKSKLSSSYVFLPKETLKLSKKISNLDKKSNKTFKIRPIKKFINLKPKTEFMYTVFCNKYD